MAAVSAFPYLNFALFENCRGFNILKERTVSLLMVLFDCADHTEFSCQFRKTFFLCCFGKSLIHIGPLKIFSVRRRSQIFGSIADSLQFLKPHFCVLFLIVRSFQKEGGNLLIAFFFGYGSKIGVFIPRLRFPCKSRLKIFFRLCSGILTHFLSPL